MESDYDAYRAVASEAPAKDVDDIAAAGARHTVSSVPGQAWGGLHPEVNIGVSGSILKAVVTRRMPVVAAVRSPKALELRTTKKDPKR